MGYKEGVILLMIPHRALCIDEFAVISLLAHSVPLSIGLQRTLCYHKAFLVVKAIHALAKEYIRAVVLNFHGRMRCVELARGRWGEAKFQFTYMA